MSQIRLAGFQREVHCEFWPGLAFSTDVIFAMTGVSIDEALRNHVRALDRRSNSNSPSGYGSSRKKIVARLRQIQVVFARGEVHVVVARPAARPRRFNR